MDLTALKAEISKPAYADLDADAVSKLLARPSTNVEREGLSGPELHAQVLQSMTIAEYTAWYAGLSAPQKRYFDVLVSLPSLTFTKNVRDALQDLFPAGSPARKSVVDYFKRSGTVAEELGLGRVPTTSEISDARRL